MLSSRAAPVTIRDVAAAAGVSTATVSRVMSDRTSPGAEGGASAPVSAETRTRVREAAERLGYRVNHVARSLKRGSTRSIAVLAPEFANDFFMELAESIERELEASGYALLLCSSSNSAAEEERRLELLSRRLVDGVIVIPASSRGAHLRRVAESGMPLVLVDRLVEGASLDAVLADNEGGAYAATAAVVAERPGRAAFMGGDLSITTARERLAGFARAMAELGLPAGAEAVRLGGMGIADGYRIAGELLADPDPPRALFAVNLLVHLGIERRLVEAGAASDFAVASFDETPYSPFLPACRYGVAQDAAAMGAAAARLVLERIARPGEHGEPRILRLPTALIRHGGPASGSDPARGAPTPPAPATPA
jgi:LacI family transcriptional regulator